jgi:hypothetical protein
MSDAEPLTAELFHGIIAFIADDSDFALDEAADRLRKAFPQREVSRNPQGITVAAQRWRLWLDYVDRPHVTAESREMAHWHANHPAAGQMVECKRRVEFSGTDIAPGSECFCDLCTACEVLKGFPGVVVFDLEGSDLFC